jgi:chemotaxis protein MotB
MTRVWFVVLGAVMVVNASACVRKSTHKGVLDALARCQGSLEACNQKGTENEAKIAKIEDELVAAWKARDGETEARKNAEARLEELASSLESTRDELGVLRKQRESSERRLKAFRDLNERFRALVDTGKLQVMFRNGQMVLKLPAEVLFASGQAKLSKAGETALSDVVNILLEFKDRRFMVAGHTDDRKIRTKRFKNNWELSAARALSVVEFMIESGFAAKNVGAGGYGEFDPVATNDTEEGRQLNRRIEIILVPDLSELPTIAAEPAS